MGHTLALRNWAAMVAGVVGAASLAGGALVGALCSHSIPVLDTVVAAIRGLALAPLFTTRLRRA